MFRPAVVLVFFLLIFCADSLIAQNASSPIKIGIITSLTPLVEPWSQSANMGLQQAVKEINASGGVKGRKLKLIVEDDRFLARNALTAYRKLRDIDQVDFIIGPQFDQTMAAVRHLAGKDKQLLVQTIGTNPVNSTDYGYVVHAYPPDKFAGKSLAERIRRDGHKRVSFLVPEESYSQNFAAFVKEYLGEIEYQWINYEADITDYKPILLKARSYKPDALIFLFLMPDIAGHIYRKMRELNIHLPVYTSETLHGHKAFIKEAGQIADPTLYYIVDFDSNSVRIKKFLNKLPTEPTLPSFSVVAYDTVYWLAELIREYGVDNNKVREALYQMKYEGLFTTYEFDKSGDLPVSHWVPWKVTEDGYLRDRE